VRKLQITCEECLQACTPTFTYTYTCTCANPKVHKQHTTHARTKHNTHETRTYTQAHTMHTQEAGGIARLCWRPQQSTWERLAPIPLPAPLGACSIKAAGPVVLLPPAADTAQHDTSAVLRVRVRVPAGATLQGWLKATATPPANVTANVTGSPASVAAAVPEGADSPSFSLLASVCGAYLGTRVSALSAADCWQVGWQGGIAEGLPVRSASLCVCVYCLYVSVYVCWAAL